MSTDRKTIEVILTAKDMGYSSTMTKAAATSKGAGAEAKKMSAMTAAANGKLGGLALGLGIYGLAVAGIMTLSANASMKFEKQMSAAYAATTGTVDATVQKWGELKAAALDASLSNVAVSAGDAAVAETELLKAGRTASQVVGGELHSSLVLAAADNLDLARATSIMASTMTVFSREKGISAAKVTDILAAGAGLAQGGVSDLGEALKYAGSQAASSNTSLGETVGLLATLANNGFVGSIAGTALAGIMRNLKTPVKEAQNVFDELDFSAYNADGTFKGVTKSLEELQSKLPTGDQARSEALQKIFDVRALNAAIPLLREAGTVTEDGTISLEKMNKAVQQSGYGSTVAATQMDNLAGDVTRFQSAMNTAFIEGAAGSTNFERTAVQSATGVMKAYIALPEPIKNVLGSIMTGLGGVALAGAGLIKAAEYGKKLRDSLVTVGMEAGKATRLVKGIGIAGAGIGIALAVGLGIIGYFSEKAAESANRVKELADTFAVVDDKVIATDSSVSKLLDNLRAAKNGVGGLGPTNNFGQILDQAGLDQGQAVMAISGDQAGFDAYLAGMTDKIKAWRMKNGSPVDWLTVGGAQPEANNQALLAVDNMKQLRSEWQQGQTEARSLADASESAGLSFNTLGDAQKMAAGTSNVLATGTSALEGDIQKATAAVTAYIKQWFALRDAQSALIGSQDAFESSIDGLTTALDKKTAAQLKGKSLDDTNNAAVVKAREALRGTADAARNYGAELMTQGYSQEYASAQMEKGAAAIVKQAQDWGMNRKSAVEFAAALTGIPASVITNLTVKGTVAAEKQVASFERKFKELPDDKRITISAAIRTGDMKTIKSAIKDLPKTQQIQILSNLSSSGVKGAKAALDDITTKTAKEHNIKLDAKTAKARAQELIDKLNQIKSKSITITATTTSRQGGPKAGGGAIIGAGTGTSDSIDARLSNGEHVWTASEVNSVGGQAAVYRMRSLARAGALRGFRDGGAVGGHGIPHFARGGGVSVGGSSTMARAPIQYIFQITNHYPQAEPTTVTANRALQLGAALGRA